MAVVSQSANAKEINLYKINILWENIEEKLECIYWRSFFLLLELLDDLTILIKLKKNQY